MPNEYYDRPHTDRKPFPASRTMQDLYWLLRSNLTQAIAKDMAQIIHACPDVHAAHQQLNAFLDANPTRSFRVFRPEDSEATIDADTPSAFLR